ncbi:hypothetical protein HDU78_005167 [Chytriomyces hyalinus]|nr:hypothetical protein HDU78_005167 [Chytriomyces hyalinus]
MDSANTLLGRAMAQKSHFVATIAKHQSTVGARAVTQTNPPESSSSKSNLSVNFRTRPLSTAEIKQGFFPVLFCTETQTTLYYPSFRMLTDSSVDVQEFEFDGNFAGEAGDAHVYETAVQQKFFDVLNQNGILTIMAYGQTGSGKTYTMMNIAEKLVNDFPFENDISAFISIIEIQGDVIRDLSVAGEGRKVPAEAKVLLDGAGLPVLQNVAEYEAKSKEQVLEFFHHGFAMRTTRSTLKNAASSRSHFICTIRICGGKLGFDAVVKLVDLAGSETGSDKKDHDAVRLKEAISINKSLMSLKECIRKSTLLSETSEDASNKSSHIPFRSSKLTMVLKDALDPTLPRFTSTVVFALAAPTVADIPHTFNTYRYALALKSLNRSDDKDASILEHKAAAKSAEPASQEKLTPMAWSRAKLERWIELQFENQVQLTDLLGPRGDPSHFGRHAADFVLPAWKFLYSMSADEWIANAKTHAKFADADKVGNVREKYKKLFLKERATVKADGLSTSVTGKVTLLSLEENVVTEKKLSRAELAMQKAKAKGAALRATSLSSK